MRVDLPYHHGNRSAELTTDSLSKDERIVGWIDEYGTITDNNGERIGDVVGIMHEDLSALVLRYRGEQMSRWGFSVGDEAVMDSKVKGKVDGFYRDWVVFTPEWQLGRGIWGRLDLKTDEPDADALDVKHCFMGSMLVHPSNLRKPEK